MTTKLENPSNLVIGMGVGVFVIFIFAIILILIFGFTTQATNTEKILWRGISTSVFAIIIVILIFSERESRFYYQGFEQQIYDNSFIPRIVIACILFAFSLVCGVLVFDESGVSKETSTVDVEYTALWQH
jgi:hypothetical protein